MPERIPPSGLRGVVAAGESSQRRRQRIARRVLAGLRWAAVVAGLVALLYLIGRS